MLSNLSKYLTFNDIGILPRYSSLLSRTCANINTKLDNNSYNIPWIPANMDTVIDTELAKKIGEHKGCVIFHRFTNTEKILNWYKEFPEAYFSVGSILTPNSTNKELLNELYIMRGCRRFCIDIAHGDSIHCVETIKYIRQLDELHANKVFGPKRASIIAGNVCTYDGYLRLVNAGANIIKVGIGPGSVCTTRIMTGVGVPQFSAILECNRAKKYLEHHGVNSYMIADGGITHPRDAVISLGAGADAVMMGKLFASTFEAPIYKNKQQYRGQSSSEFMNDYYKKGNKNRTAEGVAFSITNNYSCDDLISKFNGGLQSAMSYVGAHNLKEFKENIEFFQTSSNYMVESNYRS